MVLNRWYNFSKVRKTYTRKHSSAQCRKREKYMEMRDTLANIY
jgi:hypothetical protein